MIKSKFYLSRISLAIIGACVLFFLLSLSTGRQTYQAWQIDHEIQGLQEQVATLEGNKSELLNSIQRLQTTDEIDKQARAQLGLRKPGERVIVLPEDAVKGFSNTRIDAAGTADTNVTPQPSNPKKWLRYFFHAES